MPASVTDPAAWPCSAKSNIAVTAYRPLVVNLIYLAFRSARLAFPKSLHSSFLTARCRLRFLQVTDLEFRQVKIHIYPCFIKCVGQIFHLLID